jgi:predicted nucleic acid-binding protein
LKQAREVVYIALTHNITLFTSCDILSNIYYVGRKNLDKNLLIKEMLRILDIFEIIEIDKNLSRRALVKNASNLSDDFEDLLQVECAKSYDCDLIVTNDKKFIKSDVKHLSLDTALKRLNSIHV